MSKQDRNGARTAQDLERKYDLGAIRDSTKQGADSLDRLEKELRTFAKEISDEVSKKAAKEDIPTKVSELENDSKYLTAVPAEYITETELNEKGYLTSVPDEYVTETELENKKYATQETLGKHTSDTVVHVTADERTAWNGKAEPKAIPTKVSQLENDSKYLTEVTEENLPTEYIEELIATAIENAYIEVENEAGGITVIIGHG